MVVPVVSALERLRQENHELGYNQDPPSKVIKLINNRLCAQHPAEVLLTFWRTAFYLAWLISKSGLEFAHENIVNILTANI